MPLTYIYPHLSVCNPYCIGWDVFLEIDDDDIQSYSTLIVNLISVLPDGQDSFLDVETRSGPLGEREKAVFICFVLATITQTKRQSLGMEVVPSINALHL